MTKTNNLTSTVKVSGVTLSDEERIRDCLPPKVKHYLLECLSFPVPWGLAWTLFNKMGEANFLAYLQKMNAQVHLQHYGPGFYRSFSPYRELFKPKA